MLGRKLSSLQEAALTSSLSSGTATKPTLGSIVQKGKLPACALAESQMALNRVLLPTLGMPTMPVWRDIEMTEVLHRTVKWNSWCCTAQAVNTMNRRTDLKPRLCSRPCCKRRPVDLAVP